jgi:diketogulonate reductase-like aldo/keto reductase
MATLCAQHGLQVMAASPLGAPHKVGAYLTHQRSIGKELDEATSLVLASEAVAGIAAELGCTAGQLVLRWGIQRGHSVIPKSFAPHPHLHLSENFAAAQQPALSEIQMARILSLDRGLRATALYKSAESNGGRVADACVVL